MSYRALVLKACVKYGSSGGPGFRNSIVETEGGIESRNRIWTYQRSQWELAYAADVGISFEELYQFFQIMGGSLHSFLLIDPLDKYCPAGEGVFVESLGSPTYSQMARRITVGAYSVDMLVTKPRSDVTLVGGAAPSVDPATGIASGNPSSWYGYYYKHARFNIDLLQPVITNKKQASGELIVEWQTLPLIEVRGDNENT